LIKIKKPTSNHPLTKRCRCWPTADLSPLRAPPCIRAEVTVLENSLKIKRQPRSLTGLTAFDEKITKVFILKFFIKLLWQSQDKLQVIVLGYTWAASF